MKLHASVVQRVCICILVSLKCGLSASSNADVPTRVSPPVAVLQSDLEILKQARSANDNAYKALQSFVCNEQIDRFMGTISGAFGQPVDTVTAKLSFERGVEQYSDVHQNKILRDDLSSLTGAWSEGEFGTLLLQTQRLLQTQPVEFQNFESFSGAQAAIFRFDVAVEDSPWDLAVSSRHFKIPFRTDVWISVKTGEILKIHRTSLAVFPEARISQIEWSITLDHVDINGKIWLLPRTGTYAVLYEESQRREWNVMNFTDYKRYSAETALRFN